MCHPEPDRNALMDRNVTKTSPFKIAAFWILVLIPLGWGVVQSVVKSLPLFQMTTVPGSKTSSR